MAERRLPIKRSVVNGEVVTKRGLARREPGGDDGPSPDDLERFGGVTRTCPSCGKEVYDDASSCYHCGVELDVARHAQLPKTWIVLVVLALIAGLVFFLTR